MQYKNLKLLDFVKTALPQLVLSAEYIALFSRLWLPRMFICFGIKLIFTIINQTNSS